jgi:undecaprenyl-diphosphatase
MQLLQAILLGVVQGLTEFIPVSSSGHLILFEKALGFQGGLVFDLALHLGTLLALLLVFGGDLVKLFWAVMRREAESRLVGLMALATLPAVAAGLALQPLVEGSFRSPVLVAINLIAVAVVMLFVDRQAKRHDPLSKIDGRKAGLIGLAQAAAIVPGVSRSGSTITAGLALGLSGEAATRFSFLLAVPAIAGAILKVGLNDSALQEVGMNPGVFIVGIVSAFVSGYAAIKFMLAFLTRRGLAPFAYYRIGLGILVLIMGATKWV